MKLILLFAILTTSLAALKILIFNPAFGYSQSRFMGVIADVLSEAGHDFTEIRPTIDTRLLDKWVSNTQKVLRFPVHPEVDSIMTDFYGPDGFMGLMWTMDLGPDKAQVLAVNMTEMFTRACDHLVLETDLFEQLKKEKFDVGLSESFDNCGHGIFEGIKLKNVITTSSMPVMDHQALLLGIPRVPSYVPGTQAPFSDQMSIGQRAFNTLMSHYGAQMFLDMAEKQTKAFRRKFGGDFPEIQDLISSSAMLFTNAQPFLDFPRPTIHKVVDLGGIHINETVVDENKDFDKILSRKPKTVLISFGSVAKSYLMPDSYKKSIITAVKSLPDVQFIWKYEEDDLKSWDLPENLYLSKWVPQASLLADPRLKLFVTHGGLASVTEVAYSGMPAIVVPLFADQPRNAYMIARQQSAEVFSKFDLDKPEKFAAVIRKILVDSRYQEKATFLSELLKNSPFTPKELLLRNVEFVARFGALPQLDPYARHLTFVHVPGSRPSGESRTYRAQDGAPQLTPCMMRRPFVCFAYDALNKPYPKFPPNEIPEKTQKAC
ncbi:unnamed protein product, partial [Mesorhabditis spiculigera]